MILAVIGDIHGFWDDRDTAFFNASNYDGLLFVGDFARWTNSLPVARMLAGLTRPAWAIAGNHDAVSKTQLMAEIKNRRLIRTVTGLGMDRRVRALATALGPVRLNAYSMDALDDNLSLLTARPHAMGPDRFYYKGYLKRQYGVVSYADSTARLKTLVDQAAERIIILAHNGPSGLGDAVDAPFGNDFNPEYGDFGDPDLRAAIDYARAGGRQVLAVVAGHMHHRNRKTGVVRKTWDHDGETLYLNTARVPRMKRDGSRRHHIALTISDAKLSAETVFVSHAGKVEMRETLGPTG